MFSQSEQVVRSVGESKEIRDSKGDKQLMRKLSLTAFLVVLSLTIAVPAAFAARGGEGGRGDGPVI